MKNLQGLFTYLDWDVESLMIKDFRNKGIIDITKTAETLIKKYGNLIGNLSIFEDKNYKIIKDDCEKQPTLTILSKKNNQIILKIENYRICVSSPPVIPKFNFDLMEDLCKKEKEQTFCYQLSEQDIENFQELAQELKRNKN